MNGKSDEKLTNEPIRHARPRPKILRLVERDDQEPILRESAATVPVKRAVRPHWHDDDDPGPSAA
jgi:hypothetical protein